MQDSDSSLFIFNSHIDAEDAIRALDKSGFDVKKLSLIGKGYHSEEHPIGFYTVGDRIKTWGGLGAFWGGIWGLLLAPGVFVLPGLGLIAMAGPIIAAVVGALEGAAVVGGVSVLAAALTQLGVPKNQVVKYETALKADKYVLLIHGASSEVEQARSILSSDRTWAKERDAVVASASSTATAFQMKAHASDGGIHRAITL